MAQGAIAAGSPLEDVHTRTTASGPQSMACCVGVDGSDSVVTDHATRGLRVDAGGSSTLTGTMNIVTTTGAIPARLNGGTPVPCKSVLITASPSNTALLAVGDTSVKATAADFQGIPLAPGRSITLDVEDANSLYINAELNSTTLLTWQVIR